MSDATERALLRITDNPAYFALIAEALGLLFAAHVMDKPQGGDAA